MCRLFYLIASLLYHYFTVVLLNHCLYLLVHVFCREAQLFVQHFVRSGETERFQSPNLTVGAYQTFQRNGQAGRSDRILLHLPESRSPDSPELDCGTVPRTEQIRCAA